MSLPKFARPGLAFTLSALLGVSCTLTATAQSVATTPVGAVSVDLAQGYTLVGLSLLEPALFTGGVSENTSSSITLSDSVNIGALLAADGLYYAEVTSGALEGERFDLNTSATIAQNSNGFVINTTSINNTYVLNPEDLTSNKISIRKHITLEKIASAVTPALVGNNSVGSADQILIYDTQLSALQTYFLRADNITWRKSGAPESVGKTTIIPPSAGFFIRRNSAPAKLTHVGEVRINDFAMPIASGLQLYTYPFPVPASPTSLGGTAALGWSGSNSVSVADQIIVLNPLTGGYDTYFLRADGITWRKSGSAEDVRAIDIVNSGSGFWIKKANAETNYILTLPYAL